MFNERHVSIEQLTIDMAKYIKETAKEMNGGSKKVNIKNGSWGNYINGKFVWSRSVICLGHQEYEFKDKEIKDYMFIDIVKKALAMSKVVGEVNTRDTYIDFEKTVVFDSLVILGKPCKEFVSLNHLLKKYAGKELCLTNVSSVSVCGKRNAWSESGEKSYLAYDTANCKKAIDFIREKRTSKDTLSFEVKNSFSHGDNCSYQHAMQCESEWYGSNCDVLILKVTTPKGKEKGNLSVAPRISRW